MDRLPVFYKDKLVGYISTRKNYSFVFEYSRDWLEDNNAFAISLSLPLQAGVFAPNLSTNFFENLLPEELDRLKLANSLNVARADIFAMLKAIGSDCAGAISIGETHKGYKKIDKEAFTQTLKELPSSSEFSVSRFSLAGAGAKLSLSFVRGEYYKGSPNNIIVKVNNSFENIAENEYFCMLLAKSLNLNVPNVALTNTEPQALRVRRYDRIVIDRQLVRLHQEDFCQALGVGSDKKYDVTLRDCFNLLNKLDDVAVNKLKFFKIVFYNFLIGNYDAHGKNFSLLYDQDNKPCLAPFYDLICVDCYDLPKEYVMKINGKRKRRHIYPDDWLKVATLADITQHEAQEIMSNMARDIRIEAQNLANVFEEKYGKNYIIDKILETIDKNTYLYFDPPKQIRYDL